jgi:hypothetical protein
VSYPEAHSLVDLSKSWSIIANRTRFGDYETWDYLIPEAESFSLPQARAEGRIVTAQKRLDDGRIYLLAGALWRNAAPAHV